MEERNKISLEELTEKIDNRMEKIYSLILKFEDTIEEQKIQQEFAMTLVELRV